jgi:hypothetical protein
MVAPPHAVETSELTSIEGYVLNLLVIQQQHPLASPFSIGKPFSSVAEIEKAKSNIFKGHIYEELPDKSEEPPRIPSLSSAKRCMFSSY